MMIAMPCWISFSFFVPWFVNQKLAVIIRHLTICLIFLTLIFSCNAQGTYALHNLKKVSCEQLFVYYQKSLNLERKGEIIALTGGVVGLLGILAGAAITDNNSSNGNLNLLELTAASMIAGGSIATVIGFSFYMTGATRINRINKIKTVELLRLELIPNAFCLGPNRNYQPAIIIRMSF